MDSKVKRMCVGKYHAPEGWMMEGFEYCNNCNEQLDREASLSHYLWFIKRFEVIGDLDD